MVFKRRQPLGWLAWMREMVYPKGGFKRATRYVIHRMSRLPDDPHRIARGIFAGFLVGFLPLPGLQFVAAWAAARLVRGNLLAALLGTFNTNPVTTPFFAVFAMSFGHWIMGVPGKLSFEAIIDAFGVAGADLWRNFVALFTPAQMHWGGLIRFWHEIYVPYFIGALLPGLVISAVAYYLTIPLVQTYQKARAAKADDRRERRHRLKLAVADAKNRLLHRTDKDGESRPAGDDTGAGAQ
ncbi:hypothetical protein GCM10010873_03230 [Cypionkella aquatica]|uniref:DUF2062 domain-containing protein n=1 Tax=Cypionkella aquatica TaxID=1756042 RepID=A0AA37TTG0_9RHOB|nr:DUF2062 domain-containing protein [Cypionkella aquatica]GLS85350.1 hypothetical protein GCM10010873_03230 [Cypionkella aquatica]